MEALEKRTSIKTNKNYILDAEEATRSISTCARSYHRYRRTRIGYRDCREPKRRDSYVMLSNFIRVISNFMFDFHSVDTLHAIYHLPRSQ